MKNQVTLWLLLAALLFAGCHKKKEFGIYTVSGERCYLQVFDEPFIFDLDTIGTKITYAVDWPDEGLLSNSALRELQYVCFGDSTAASVEQAAQQWMDGIVFYDEGHRVPEKSGDGYEGGVSIAELEGGWEVNDNLATFSAFLQYSPFGAAHGTYSCNILTVDLESGNAVHLADLVTDTNLLCEAVAHAIQDLDVNGEVRECLFDEFRDVERMPLPRDFVIDSALNGITVFYSLYEVAPYACGIQAVTLPIFWLSKHVPLTPYAKRLFGPGCSIE